MKFIEIPKGGTTYVVEHIQSIDSGPTDVLFHGSFPDTCGRDKSAFGIILRLFGEKDFVRIPIAFYKWETDQEQYENDFNIASKAAKKEKQRILDELAKME